MILLCLQTHKKTLQQHGYREQREEERNEWRKWKKDQKANIAWDDNDSSDGSEKEINLLTKDYESDENISQED